MTAPAIGSQDFSEGRTRRSRRRFAVPPLDAVVEGLFRLYAVLFYGFLFLPIVLVIVFAFNQAGAQEDLAFSGRLATIWTGFTTDWFGNALSDPVVINALGNSAIIAIGNAILATAFGTMAALGLQRVGARARRGFDVLTYLSIIVPEIVIALATLIFFSTAFDFLNPILAGLQGGQADAFQLGLGPFTIVSAQVLWNLSLVLLIVRARLSGMDRTLVEASQDLFATPWQTFRQITFPQLAPAIVAGFLLAFTFSFDDYLIANFLNGPGSTTLPIFIFGQVKLGVTPETNAIAAMILGFTVAVLLAGQAVLWWMGGRSGSRATSMTSMVMERPKVTP